MAMLGHNCTPLMYMPDILVRRHSQPYRAKEHLFDTGSCLPESIHLEENPTNRLFGHIFSRSKSAEPWTHASPCPMRHGYGRAINALHPEPFS